MYCFLKKIIRQPIGTEGTGNPGKMLKEECVLMCKM